MDGDLALRGSVAVCAGCCLGSFSILRAGALRTCGSGAQRARPREDVAPLALNPNGGHQAPSILPDPDYSGVIPGPGGDRCRAAR